jgi:hypothetical protein
MFYQLAGLLTRVSGARKWSSPRWVTEASKCDYFKVFWIGMKIRFRNLELSLNHENNGIRRVHWYYDLVDCTPRNSLLKFLNFILGKLVFSVPFRDKNTRSYCIFRLGVCPFPLEQKHLLNGVEASCVALQLNFGEALTSATGCSQVLITLTCASRMQ